MRTVLVTGSAGFIGYHLCKRLLADGFRVVGYDAMTDYYDVELKRRRNQMLLQNANFSEHHARLEDLEKLTNVFETHKPDIIVNLAAQAGVRYSIEAPRSYVDANLIGAFNILECARNFGCEHLLMASTSSVYGANEKMPYTETDKTDTPMSFYAATKKAGELMAHSYAHLYNTPITMFRFFTVYGSWGRPDMAHFKFTRAILADTEIDVYNHGDMMRDFTYVDDLVNAIRLLIECPPKRPEAGQEIPKYDSLSPVAPHRVVNIGNSEPVKLMDFIDAIEQAIGKKAKKNFLDMQQGDVPATWADALLLTKLTGYKPETDVREGVREFVSWYRDYYRI